MGERGLEIWGRGGSTEVAIQENGKANLPKAHGKIPSP